MSAKDGGPAFPFVERHGDSTHYHYSSPGMSLRDYFAGKVLPSVYLDAVKDAESSGLFSAPYWREALALDAYKLADAMLAAREQQP